MLKSSFLPVNNALDYQKTNTIYPGILATNPKIKLLNFKINMEILNSQIFEKNIYSGPLNFGRSPAFNYKQYFTNWIEKSSSFIPISKYFSVKCLKS